MLPAPDMNGPVWRKSTRSGANGCVEVAALSEEVAVRDTKDRRGPVLQFTAGSWQGFIASIRMGRFDIVG